MDAEKMMKKDVFASFAEKARKKLEEKKKQRTEKLHIPDLGETITITALTDQELMEVRDFSEDDNANDIIAGDSGAGKGAEGKRGHR